MFETFIIANALFAILLIVAMVIWLNVHPLIALIVGPMYLGLTSGLGFQETIKAITGGFGELMGEIGLLIGFGVMIGAFMHQMGAFQKVVQALTARFSDRKMPYAFMTVLTGIFPSIYTDVLLLMAVPLAKSVSRTMGRNGVPMMASSVAVGIYMALTLVVPGVAALALSAVLKVDLGTMLLTGLAVALPTGFVTMIIYRLILSRGLWKPELDEQQDDTPDSTVLSVDAPAPHNVPLRLSLLPVLIPVLMISIGAIDRATSLDSPVLSAMGNSTFALFVGMIIAILVARFCLPRKDRQEAFNKAFHESGQILLLTGVAGSLSAVVTLTDLGNILSGYFSHDATAPLLLVWAVAAILHVAIGSVSASAITAAALLAPIAQTLAISPVYIALAAGSGALFLVHVTSNSFWLMSTLMGLTVRGTLKTLTLAVSIASLVSLPIILGLSALI
ncbi:GntP family permease [Agrobacterium rosae]|uniref:SLC13 family permease n=1 Tax=Agrobacterium rosae TaxID=1972867 RepID=A0AAE5RY65_9HYPH|nr:SLC13 family permease [Agrobacterium rosae]KAA3511417.1 hypothetical protein DXM21_13165 [Agrobacterium rosae]KAA3519159.1 hypothetical protein DXM25_14860 [Agrobacterium rosae]MCM2436199.1 hypothetical protein [Agrobacterium rosae]MDX8332268.1 SLC13 family permease [Agrobacterium rosae]MQB49088.1 hypothetical protein [Agrobacterium rosae]